MPAKQFRCEVYVVPESDRTGENAIECGAIALACADCVGPLVVTNTRSSAQYAVIPFVMDVSADMPAAPSLAKARPREARDDEAPPEDPTTADLDLPTLRPCPHRGDADAAGL